ncbi:rod shape-determining protein MreC [Marinilabiliaceae bacterium JC017]|nr:rod shape-determining protein MreC [Marinilabiliaceae bacterium JC017]
MRNFIRFILRHHFVLLFLLIELFSFALVVNYNDYQRSSWFSSSNRFAGFILNKSNNASQYFMLREINEELARENAYLRGQMDESFRISKDYFSVVFDSLSQQQYVYRAAKVINNSVNRHFNYITLDKGTDNGIEPGMGVISARGVVGIVTNVSKRYSTVISLLNTRLKISSKLKETNFFGSLEWDGQTYEYANLSGIPRHATVSVGDLVVTSGYSAIFPEGILIGTVETVEKGKGESFYDIRVKLSVDFKRLAFVEVIGNNMKEEQVELENITKND